MGEEEDADFAAVEPILDGPDEDGLYWAEYPGEDVICLGASLEEAEQRLMAIEGIELDREALLIE